MCYVAITFLRTGRKFLQRHRFAIQRLEAHCCKGQAQQKESTHIITIKFLFLKSKTAVVSVADQFKLLSQNLSFEVKGLQKITTVLLAPSVMVKATLLK